MKKVEHNSLCETETYKAIADIKTVKIKECNSSWKHILIVCDVPVCIVKSNKTLQNCISYLMNGEPKLTDGKIMKILDKVREMTEV